ncbi:GRB2-associated-binding protein 3-like isoform X3 [Manis pentadactyla]|uniref:GRB2-associated-binding protein 3-like isoform X3 n=1 Tax=Manis pentadactyla TaxID=143292 RepID=UPI00255C491E|nr:GRB2-associated-binding protein 3-like isoform X3 [Manis pentadactyla]
MSAGDAVCTGWLVKSPPERKLQRYAWRKRWFVLRQGRMSGDPNVLEYYRNKHSSKPIRAIDLSECAVWKHVGPGFVRKEFQNNFVFIVKTTSRTFYLVANTEVEMQVWVYSITQVCNLGHLEGGAADSMESFSRMPSSLQPSPASCLHTSHAVSSSSSGDDPRTNTTVTEERRSESEFLSLPDYTILSNCETGRPRQASLPTRCDSWSNSDRSLKQASFDDVFVDYLQPLPSSTLVHASRHGNGSQKAPPMRPQAALIWSRDISGPSTDRFSSPLLKTSLNSTIHVDKNQGSLPYGVKEVDIMFNTPPPRPPKPSYLSERRQEEQHMWSGHSGIQKAKCTAAQRRISLSGLDNVPTWKADVEGQSLRHRDKRLSLNLPCRFSPVRPTASASVEDSYVPMGPVRPTASASVEDSYVPMGPQPIASGLGPHFSPNDYIPMSSGIIPSPLSELPADLEPPPVNRHLKPQRKPRPPPLDPRNLSTIREHTSLTRSCTVPCNRTRFLSPERNDIHSARFFAHSVSREEEESYIQMKLLLSEEQKVNYVQVDEQKTQALQKTKQEWTHERQSKV